MRELWVASVIRDANHGGPLVLLGRCDWLAVLAALANIRLPVGRQGINGHIAFPLAHRASDAFQRCLGFDRYRPGPAKSRVIWVPRFQAKEPLLVFFTAQSFLPPDADVPVPGTALERGLKRLLDLHHGAGFFQLGLDGLCLIFDDGFLYGSGRGFHQLFGFP